jgi:hypothetical protein
VKSSPRFSKFGYWSKLASAGASSTTSPGSLLLGRGRAPRHAPSSRRSHAGSRRSAGRSRGRNGRSDRLSPPIRGWGLQPRRSRRPCPCPRRSSGSSERPAAPWPRESTLVALLSFTNRTPPVRPPAGCGAAGRQSCAARLRSASAPAQAAAGGIGRAGVLVVVRAGQTLDLAQVDARPPAAPCAIRQETPCGRRPTSRTLPAFAPRRPGSPGHPPAPCPSWPGQEPPLDLIHADHGAVRPAFGKEPRLAAK